MCKLGKAPRSTLDRRVRGKHDDPVRALQLKAVPQSAVQQLGRVGFRVEIQDVAEQVELVPGLCLENGDLTLLLQRDDQTHGFEGEAFTGFQNRGSHQP